MPACVNCYARKFAKDYKIYLQMQHLLQDTRADCGRLPDKEKDSPSDFKAKLRSSTPFNDVALVPTTFSSKTNGPNVSSLEDTFIQWKLDQTEIITKKNLKSLIRVKEWVFSPLLFNHLNSTSGRPVTDLRGGTWIKCLRRNLSPQIQYFWISDFSGDGFFGFQLCP